jgi:hypothetical protein
VHAGDYLSAGWTDAGDDVGKIIGLVSNVLAYAKYEGKPAPYRFESLAKPLCQSMKEFEEALRNERSSWLSSFEQIDDLVDGVLPQLRNPSGGAWTA